MTWRIVDHEGQILQSGFNTYAEAHNWVKKFINCFKIEKGD